MFRREIQIAGQGGSNLKEVNLNEKEMGRFTITEVAEKIGVTTKTIIRWEKAGKIKRPKRDWKGWRVYLQEDLDALERLVNSVYEME